MILARFHDPDALDAAARRLAAMGVEAETYGPTAPEAAGHSIVPMLMLGLGLAAFAGTFAMQAYATTNGYRLDVGGRPDLYWPAFLPFSIEAGMLFAMLGGLLGFLVLARMPALYDPVDEGAGFAAASRDAWFLTIAGEPPDAAQVILRRADSVEDLPE